jgi:hypothetical protein
MDSDTRETMATGRREFLARLSWAVAGSAAVLGTAAGAERTVAAVTGTSSPPLPTIRLGRHDVSRLIAGSNPINGYSYQGPLMDRHMREYFTPERIVEFLTHCERAGINTHQFGGPGPVAGIIRTLRERGSKMKFLCLHSSERDSTPVAQVVREHELIALVHHGGVTDRLFQQGKSGQVHDFVKRVHDAGLLAGVSAHNPDCIQRIADEGWEVDLFMTCFYHLTRTREELAKMPEVATLEVSYPFFAADPATMTKVVRQVHQPCLGFKILAAGRSCHDKQSVRAAFQFTFEHIKPADGVIVGMYPRFHDQIAENAGFVRQLGRTEAT